MSDNPNSNPLWWIPGYQPPKPPEPKKKIVSSRPPAGRSTGNESWSWILNSLWNTVKNAGYPAHPSQPSPLRYQYQAYKPSLTSPFPSAAGSTAKNPYTIHYAPYSAYNTQVQRAKQAGYTGPLLNFQNPNMTLADAQGGDYGSNRLYDSAARAGLPPGGVPGIPDWYWNPYLDPVLGDHVQVMDKWQQAAANTRQTQQARSGYSGYGYGGGYSRGGYGGGGGYKAPNKMDRWYSELVNWRI
jgi:hypothetical protein